MGFAAGDANLYRYVGNDATNKTDPTGLLETDDRETRYAKLLVDSDKKLEQYINEVISKARKDATDANDFVRRVYEALGTDEPGSGVMYKGGSRAQQARLGMWLRRNLKEGEEKVSLRFSESRYAPNTARGLFGSKVWSQVSDETADHSISPTIRSGGTLMGTDKWEHFAQQGYWLWYWSNNSVTLRPRENGLGGANPLKYKLGDSPKERRSFRNIWKMEAPPIKIRSPRSTPCLAISCLIS